LPEWGFGLSLAGLPSWASFVSTGNGSGVLRLAPGAADVRGDYAVRVVAQDLNSTLTSLATQKHFIVSLASFSEAPQLSAPTRVVAVIGQELRVPLSASDLDQDALDWSAIGLPPGARIEPGVQYGHATLVFTPTAAGVHDISIRLSDAGLPPEGTVLPEDFVPTPNNKTRVRVDFLGEVNRPVFRGGCLV